MGNRYGIYQTSPNSCVFYKQDQDGNQSTFNLFVSPKKDKPEKSIFAFIDNEQLKGESWANNKAEIEEIIEKFGGWASDAPIMFELEAQKSMSQCLSAALKKEDGE